MKSGADIETLVRHRDYDRYISALFAPEASRAHLFALYAFNYEIAKTAETVSEPVMGQIRLQWWRETLEGIFRGSPRRHEVAEALAAAVQAASLPLPLLETLIDAREADLDSQGFADFASLERYADATSGTLVKLALRVLGAGDEYDDAARDAGRAYAFTGLMRALAHFAATGRVMLPRDRMREAGLTEDDVKTGRDSAALKRVVAEVSQQARLHLKAASAHAVPRRFLPALLPASLVPAYLRLINREGFRPFRHEPSLPVHRRQLAMLSAMMRGRL